MTGCHQYARTILPEESGKTCSAEGRFQGSSKHEGFIAKSSLQIKILHTQPQRALPKCRKGADVTQRQTCHVAPSPRRAPPPPGAGRRRRRRPGWPPGNTFSRSLFNCRSLIELKPNLSNIFSCLVVGQHPLLRHFPTPRRARAVFYPRLVHRLQQRNKSEQYLEVHCLCNDIFAQGNFLGISKESASSSKLPRASRLRPRAWQISAEEGAERGPES